MHYGRQKCQRDQELSREKALNTNSVSDGGGQLRESIWSKINNAVPFSRQTKSVECGAVLFGICPLFFISLHPPENWEALPLTPHQSS